MDILYINIYKIINHITNAKETPVTSLEPFS